ncbi:MAG: DUF2231 domain-containing protein [Capsulimonadaceae bacterium]|nr:DUF2231 domain-containing protein [Capsulimonadaceae bacterium]
MNTRIFALPALLVAILLSATAVQARPGFLPTLLTTYPSHATALRENGCLNCHTSKGSSARNAYGLAIEKAFKASGDDDLSADVIKQVEAESATTGGPTFLSLINADKNPGSTSTAAASPAAKPTSATSASAAKSSTSAASVHKTATPKSAAATVSATSATKPKATNAAKPQAAPVAKPGPTAAKVATVAATAPTAATAPPVPTAAPIPAPPASPAAAPAPEPAAPEQASGDSSATLKPPFGIPDYAFHPAIVHFPIALFIGGLVLDLLGFIRKDKNLLFAGWFNLALAATSALAAVATGLAALIFMSLPLKGLILEHMLLALVSTVLMWAMFGLRAYRHENMITPARIVYMILALITFALIGYVGHLGGEFVYGH